MYGTKKLLLIASLSTTFVVSANETGAKPYDGAVNRLVKDERESSRALTELGVADTIGLQTGLGYIMDERVTYKVPNIYWVQTHKEELVKLSPTEITTIPVAMNNILENIAEHGWDRFVNVTDDEYKEWKKTKGNLAFQYVDTDFKGDRHFRAIDPILYMKAEILYNQAIADVAAIEAATNKKVADVADHVKADGMIAQEKTAISQALEKHFRANIELSMTLKLQDLVQASSITTVRKPASLGEHAEKLSK